MSETTEELKAHFNRETSKIHWSELQRFYARGVVIAVEDGADLIDIAIAMHRDDKEAVATWLESGRIFKVEDEHARQWAEANAEHWAVVVAPWVLVQQHKDAQAIEKS